MPANLYMLDTNALVLLVRSLRARPGAPPSVREKGARILARTREAIEAGAAVGVSAITVSELEYGASKSTRSVRERRAVSRILAPFELLDYDAVRTPRHYGQIRATLEARGTPIGAMDLLIAAHAMAAGATLVTSNAGEFGRVEGLRCEDWAQPRSGPCM